GPAAHVGGAPQQRPAAVFEEDPVATLFGLPAEPVEVEGPEALRGQDRLVHLHFPMAGREVELAYGSRLLQLVLRIQVLEEHAERPGSVERDVQALGSEARAR